MPYTYEIDDSVPLVTLRASGGTNPAERREIFERVRADPKWTGRMPVLMDDRHALLGPASGQGPMIADVIRRYFAGHPVAILVDNVAMFGVARQVGFLTDGHVGAFTEPAAAVAWLIAQADLTIASPGGLTERAVRGPESRVNRLRVQ
jgi:hypothetical protein